jgi:hypothetical protein
MNLLYRHSLISKKFRCCAAVVCMLLMTIFAEQDVDVVIGATIAAGVRGPFLVHKAVVSAL